MSNLHISISAEPIFHLGPFAITNSIFTSWIVTAIIISISLWAFKNIKSTKRPKGLQNFLEMLVDGIYNMTAGIAESKLKTDTFFPFFLSFFMFILLNNWFGLLPGVGTIGFRETESAIHEQVVRPNPFITEVSAMENKIEEVPVTEAVAETTAHTSESEKPSQGKFVPYLRAGTADLNTTIALALISVIATQIIGIKFLGLAYFKKFFNLKGPIDAFVGLLETVSEISKIISFAFRLFGNIFAGEVLLAVMSFLVPILVPTPFIGLEIFVGVIQAFVFAMLTLVFMNMASIGHDDEHKAHA